MSDEQTAGDLFGDLDPDTKLATYRTDLPGIIEAARYLGKAHAAEPRMALAAACLLDQGRPSEALELLDSHARLKAAEAESAKKNEAKA